MTPIKQLPYGKYNTFRASNRQNCRKKIPEKLFGQQGLTNIDTWSQLVSIAFVNSLAATLCVTFPTD